MSFEEIDWNKLETRVTELNGILMSPALEIAKRAALQKELAYLMSISSMHRDLCALEQRRSEFEQQRRDNTDPEIVCLFDEERVELDREYEQLNQSIEKLLFPPDDRDNASVFLEIRAGAGGQEAALFVADLARMYMMYALQKNWKASVASESPTDLGGYREIILHIQGKGVFGHLKFESGVHRVQRVPSTECAGRIHTSTVTVAVLPEVPETEIVIDPKDLRIDTYRAGGAGGQHVNKTDSAVRITHLPTNLVVTCQDDRSQHKNKANAMKMLYARLTAAQKEKQEAEISQQRREQVGGGTRAEKVRTYNFPQNRVTDHQVDVTLNKLNMVMDGDLHDIIEPLRAHEYQERRLKPFQFDLHQKSKAN